NPGRFMAHYLLHCEASGLEVESITFEQVTLYIRRLLPGQENAVANSTLHQRLTAIRCGTTTWCFRGIAYRIRYLAASTVACVRSLDIQAL
ncbi:Integrase/recombinase XerC, partial [Pseudomonas savastanoi]